MAYAIGSIIIAEMPEKSASHIRFPDPNNSHESICDGNCERRQQRHLDPQDNLTQQCTSTGTLRTGTHWTDTQHQYGRSDGRSTRQTGTRRILTQLVSLADLLLV